MLCGQTPLVENGPVRAPQKFPAAALAVGSHAALKDDRCTLGCLPCSEYKMVFCHHSVHACSDMAHRQGRIGSPARLAGWDALPRWTLSAASNKQGGFE